MPHILAAILQFFTYSVCSIVASVALGVLALKGHLPFVELLLKKGLLRSLVLFTAVCLHNYTGRYAQYFLYRLPNLTYSFPKL